MTFTLKSQRYPKPGNRSGIEYYTVEAPDLEAAKTEAAAGMNELKSPFALYIRTMERREVRPQDLDVATVEELDDQVKEGRTIATLAPGTGGFEDASGLSVREALEQNVATAGNEGLTPDDYAAGADSLANIMPATPEEREAFRARMDQPDALRARILALTKALAKIRADRDRLTFHVKQEPARVETAIKDAIALARVAHSAETEDLRSRLQFAARVHLCTVGAIVAIALLCAALLAFGVVSVSIQVR